MPTVEIVENRTAQWYADRYPPKAFWDEVLKELIHTTETPSRSRHGSKLYAWPGYDGGAKAPNRTVLPDLQGGRLLLRWHFPGNSSARALRNGAEPGETNAVPGGVIQTELVGTCSPQVSRDWQRRGLVPDVDYVEWWRPPSWCLDGLAQLWVADHHRWGVPLELGSTLWPAYPSSPALDRAARMDRREFERARGLLGHLHVGDGNEHLDPGAFPARDLLRRALALEAQHHNPQLEDDVTPEDIERVADRVVAKLLAAPIGLSADEQAAGRKSLPFWKVLSDARNLGRAAANGTASLGGALRGIAQAGVATPAALEAAAAAGAKVALGALGDAIAEATVGPHTPQGS